MDILEYKKSHGCCEKKAHLCRKDQPTMENIINISFRPLEWKIQVIKNETNGYVNRGCENKILVSWV